MLIFTCHECGERITDHRQGRVVYLEADGVDHPHDARIVHHPAFCPVMRKTLTGPNGSYVLPRWMRRAGDDRLADCVGPDGLVYILSQIDGGWLEWEFGQELIKRLHVPGYEQARPLLEEARHFPASDTDVSARYPSQAYLADLLAPGDPDGCPAGSAGPEEGTPAARPAKPRRRRGRAD